MSDGQNYESSDYDDEETVKVLLATDIHLGYEHCTKRLQENDSFIAFEEILQHALEHDVDFVLLGGDLFHDSKPSQKVVLQCMEILKKYTLGERELHINFLSNPEVIFPHSAQKSVNFEDPNMNIALPIFSIHGNHDNPSFEITGSMDVLGASGLINYFGKWPDVTNVTIPPLLFNKGRTFVSVYGLSYINDQRLSRLLRDEQLILMRPTGIPEPFKILVLHQNRSKHTENGYIPENKLPDCLDLVFWGHEHECRVEPEMIEDTTADPPRRYYISQPGSSVATSLCAGEAREKKIGLLKIKQRQFKILPIKLKTVRPFVFEDLHLRTIEFESDLQKPLSDVVYEHVDEYIEHILLPKAEKQITDNPNQPKMPLIRLRVFYTKDAEVFDSIKLSRKYMERVANPRDMIILRKEKSPEDNKKRISTRADDADGDIMECFRGNEDDDWSRTVQGGIRNYFARDDKKDSLKVLSVGGLNEAVRRFVEARDEDCFKHIIDHQSKKVREYMKKFDVTEKSAIIEQLKVFREERNKAEETGEEEKEVKTILTTEAGKSRKKPTQSRAAAARDDSDVEDNDGFDDDFDDEDELPAPPSRGKGSRGRGRGARGTATTKASTRGKGRASAAKTGLDVSVNPFTPRANSTLKPQRPSDSSFAFSQFRPKPATQLKKEVYLDDSDSD